MNQPPAADAYAAIFDALAHPARRRILISLHFAGGTLAAGEIAGLFGHAWPTTTRHLQQLEAAGLIEHRREGRSRLYTLKPKRIALASDWLDWFGRDPVTAEEKKDEIVPAEHRGRRHRSCD